MAHRGFTLPELLLVLVLLGILAGIGTPHLMAAADRAALRGARSQLLRALDAARGAAIRLGQPVELLSADGALLVDPVGSHPPTWQLPAPEGSGVSLTGLDTPIRFGPAGVATGASNRTLRLRKGADTTELVVSRLGRVR